MSSFAVKGEGFEIADFDRIKAEMCPCGPSRRAFVHGKGTPSMHRVVICKQDKPHHHKTGEFYYILECGSNAAMILGGQRCPVSPGIVVEIEGGVMHCADRGGDEDMVVLVMVWTGHGSPEAQMQSD